MLRLNGGELAGIGTLDVEPGGSLVLNGGTVINDILLHGALTVYDNSSVEGALIGDVASTVAVQGITANSASLTAANGFTNAGTITLESIAASSNPSHATLAVTSGVLINAATGVLNFSPGSNVGLRILDAQLFNQGTVNVERNTTFARSVTNEGVFDIAAGTTASMSGSEQTFSQAAGDLLIEGDLSFSSSATYDQSGGSLVANGTLTVTSERSITTAAPFRESGRPSSPTATSISKFRRQQFP